MIGRRSSPRRETAASIRVDDRGVRIRLADLEVPPEEIDQRMKRHGVSKGQAASLEPRRPVAHTLVELVEQAGFPDPGLSDDEDGVRLARRRAREGILQEVELALPPNERGQAPVSVELEPRARPDEPTPRPRRASARPCP